MSAHVKVWRIYHTGNWGWTCQHPHDCPGFNGPGFEVRIPTHAEALAAAWAHIKEHS